MRKAKTVFTAKTGTGASLTASRKELRIQHASQPIMAKLTITYGTTITIELQGKMIMSASWETITTKTYTTGSPQYMKSEHATKKRFERYRLEITTNTGCTVTATIGCGDVEN